MVRGISYGNNALLTPKFSPFKERERIRRRMGRREVGFCVFWILMFPPSS